MALLLGWFPTALAASAAEPAPSEVHVVVAGEVAVQRGAFLTPRFVVNAPLGRAWVALEVTDDEPDVAGSTSRFRVPGLSYDPDRGSIVFLAEGRRFECGVTGRRSGDAVTGSGCRVVVTTEDRDVDDGFDVVQQTYAILRVELPISASVPLPWAAPVR